MLDNPCMVVLEAANNAVTEYMAYEKDDEQTAGKFIDTKQDIVSRHGIIGQIYKIIDTHIPKYEARGGDLANKAIHEFASNYGFYSAYINEEISARIKALR